MITAGFLMRPIPTDCPLAVGDVLHQAAFGFAVVDGVDAAGADVRWEAAGNLHPARLSRQALRDAYHLCHPRGLLALSVTSPELARQVVEGDAVGAIGRLLLDAGPARPAELREWLAARGLLPSAGFGPWWERVVPDLDADPRVTRDGERWSIAEGAEFPDPTLSPPEPLGPPGSCPAAGALDLLCALARAVAVLHGAGLTLRRSGDPFSRVGDTFVAAGNPGGERAADVRTCARRVLEQVLGRLPSEADLPSSALLASVADVAPDLAPELLGVLERAVSGDARTVDAFALLHDAELARATHQVRTSFPHRRDARVVAGFDTHIGVGKALGAQVNQDALLIAGEPDHALLLVADGISLCTVGSGDVASRLLVESMRRWWQESGPGLRGASAARVQMAIREGLVRANRHIMTEAARLAGGKLRDTVPMGATVVVAVTCGNRVHLASLGDSRAWLASPTGTCMLTSDQNLQAELLVSALAGLDPDWNEDRHALTGYCGHLDDDFRPALPKPFTRTFTVMPGEWVILATDGFSDFAHEREAGLGALVTTAIQSTASTTRPAGVGAMAVARRLVEASNEGGGGDNVTVLAFTLSTDIGPAERAAPHPVS